MNNERVARNPKEEILCDLFAEVLGVSRISMMIISLKWVDIPFLHLV
ncbi:hypothetical protein HFP67_27405 [Bacillus sp. CB102A.1]